MRIAKTQLIFLVLFIIHYASGNLITADFSQGTDGWNHGQGLWTIQTNANGLASNDPYLYMNPIGTAPRRGIIVWNENRIGRVIIQPKGLLVLISMQETHH